MDPTAQWGVPVKLMTDILHDTKKRTIGTIGTIGYVFADGTEAGKKEAIAMAKKGEIYNVTVVTRSDIGSHLRRMKRYLDMGIC